MATIAALGMLLAQLLLIGRVELTFDEAYYTLWSRFPAWGYLDHPPMISAWIRASTDLFGDSEFGVRALNTLIMGALPGVVAWIAWRLFGSAQAAALAAVLWLSMPLVAGAPIVTPDAPLVVFWTLGLAALTEVWRGGIGDATPKPLEPAWISSSQGSATRRNAGYGVIVFAPVLGMGLALGLATLSKFTGAFLGAGIVIAMFTTPSLQLQFTRPATYLAAAIALAVVSPFLIWNAHHDWATFAKQLGRVPGHGLKPGYLLEFICLQAALINPLTLIAAATCLRGWTHDPTREEEARRLLVSTLAPAVVYFALHASHDRVQGNWLAPLYPAVAILAAHAATHASPLARAASRYAPALGFAVITMVYLHVVTAFPILGAADPLARIGGWRELASEVFAKAHQEGAAYIVAHGYAATSLLIYYGQPSPPVWQTEEPERWTFAPPPDTTRVAAPGLAFGEMGHGLETELASRFRHVEEIARLERHTGGAVVGKYALYRVSDPVDEP